ncbi:MULTISPECIES: hypothetical protein [Photobacterium]|uniref:Uncharacterized protein n=1 Tax=Photobacterium ganghwense TaxID=320778 RepID=A0A0J1HFV9_9GAMM|nr:MULTISPECIES: hypothetical protein [Photobacterium]KLV10526.1 hypothetical protein ABT57_08325 [Photobacterium ganghwense]MBV1841536.1 hypothetical protein [Photobacterium ganghwense]PSU09571.1 hypothetical protein C9I92_08565 [Photobacterium ganghwense]QSV16814.1 hypothetical protein FH974_17765 [Photobacterium ganghwense]
MNRKVIDFAVIFLAVFLAITLKNYLVNMFFEQQQISFLLDTLLLIVVYLPILLILRTIGKKIAPK